MTRIKTRATSLIALIALQLAPALALADMDLNVFTDAPLSKERLQELSISARNYELRAQYGLLDHGSQSMRFSDMESQQDGLIHEIMMYQADGHLKNLKARIKDEGSIVARSALLLGTAYLFYNGKPFTARLSENIEVSGSAKLSAGAHTVSVTRKNLTPFNLSSGIGYERDPSANPLLSATVSKEVFRHVTATVGQKRSIASTPDTPGESVSEFHIGATF